MRYLVYIALVLCATVIAGAYGALHDQISFSVSSEYFTKFKYIQFGLLDSELPDRAKAAAIGYLATWWMGLPIGILVGAFGFLHRPARSMFSRSIRSFGIVAIVALLIGLGGLIYGWAFSSHQVADYRGWFIPEDLKKPRNFLAVGRMHNFSYLGGAIGLFFGIAYQFMQRTRPTNTQNKGRQAVVLPSSGP